MIINERLTTYLHSLETGNDAFSEQLRSCAEQTGVPLIRREMESFLAVLLSLVRPEHILEIGTGIGYSAVYMAEHSQADIVTIESYDKRIIIAKEKIAAYHRMAAAANARERVCPLQDDEERGERNGVRRDNAVGRERIRLLEGDAGNLLPKLQGPFEFIFLDAAKAQYIELLPELLRLLPSGGVLLADNVLQDGRLIESRFATERRQRTIHERMREFLWEVKHHPQLTTSVITIGDGVSLSVKKPAE